MSMKWFLRIVLIVAVLVLGALLWQWLVADPGLVQIRVRGYVIETSVVVAVAALALFIAGLWLLAWLLRAPLRWLAGRRQRRTRHAFAQAELRLREGHWARAEKLFQRAAEDAEFRVPALLEAAHAAHSRGDDSQAQAYLAQLLDDPEGRRLVALERAREAQVIGQPEQVLQHLEPLAPLPPQGHLLRLEALRQLSGRSPEALLELAELQRSQAIDARQLAGVERGLILDAIGEAPDGAALVRFWDGLPRQHKRDPEFIHAHARRSNELSVGDPAALIEAQLRHDWSDDLARLYAQLDQPEPARRRRQAEQWHKTHPDSVGLNIGLARLNLALGDRHQAQEYLGRALAMSHDSQAWELLGEACRQQPERARVALVNALRAQRGQPALAMPGDDSQDEQAGIYAVPEERSEHGLPRLPDSGGR